MLLNIFKRFSHPYQSNYCNWRTKAWFCATYVRRRKIKPKFRNSDSPRSSMRQCFLQRKEPDSLAIILFRVRAGAGSR